MATQGHTLKVVENNLSISTKGYYQKVEKTNIVKGIESVEQEGSDEYLFGTRNPESVVVVCSGRGRVRAPVSSV